MNKYCIQVLLILFTFSFAQQDSLFYNLKDYVREVILNNPELALYKIRCDQSEAIIHSKEKLGPLTSDITLDNGSSNQLSTDVLDGVDIVSNKNKNLKANLSKTFVTGSKLGMAYGYSFLESNSKRLPLDLREYNSTNMYVSLSQPLLSNLSNIYHRRELQMARFDWNSSNMSLQAKYSSIILKATETYFGLLLQKKEIEIKKHALDVARQNQKTLEQLVAKSLETQDKLLEQRAQVLEKENAVYSSQNAFLEKQAAFLEMVGREYTDSINLKSDLIEPYSLNQKAALDSIWEEALRNRPDFHSEDQNVEKAMLNVSIKNSSTLPSLNLESNYYIYGTDPGFKETFGKMGSNNYNSWSVGLKFNMVLDPRYRRDQVEPAMFALKEAEYKRETLRKQIKKDLQKLLAQTELNYLQYQAGKSSLDISTANLMEAEKLFSKKFISLEKLLEFQNSREKSELQTLQYQTEFTLNYYRLLEKKGRLKILFTQ